LDEAVFVPLRKQIRELREELKSVKDEFKLGGPDTAPLQDLLVRRDTLQDEIKGLDTKLKLQQGEAGQVRRGIEGWECPEANTWEEWLGQQPMYDQVSSEDEKREPPKTIEDFIRQESAYVPDLNDGVRVNIAPLQEAGVLAAPVLAAKDVDKALFDRIEWRSDERRWVREGKLPKPGWWSEETK